MNAVDRADRSVRRSVVLAGATLLMLVAVPLSRADPEPEPWPNTRYFERLDADAFGVPGADGVWFLAPTGQNCGIWGPGSFACSGDIPGAPPGTRALGWVAGDRAVHYDSTVAFRLPGTPAREPLPPRTRIEHNGTSCAATQDARTYCERGPLRFLITPAGTWLTPPWMDIPGG